MIVWIASYPKSGNTWARLLLSAYVYDTFDINSIDIGTSDTAMHPYQLVSPTPYPPVTMQPLLRHAALLHILFLIKQRPVFVKTHSVNGFLGSVSLFPPELSKAAVYLVRDPRDAVISFSEHMGITIDQAIDNFGNNDHMTGGEGEIVSMLTGWSHNIKSWEDETNYPVEIIRYEDMLEDTLGCLKRMLKVSGFQVNEKRSIRAVDACQLSRLRKAEKDGGFGELSGKAETFFKRGISGSWREILTIDQVLRLELDHGDMMEKYGYLPLKVLDSSYRACG